MCHEYRGRVSVVENSWDIAIPTSQEFSTIETRPLKQFGLAQRTVAAVGQDRCGRPDRCRRCARRPPAVASPRRHPASAPGRPTGGCGTRRPPAAPLIVASRNTSRGSATAASIVPSDTMCVRMKRCRPSSITTPIRSHRMRPEHGQQKLRERGGRVQRQPGLRRDAQRTATEFDGRDDPARLRGPDAGRHRQPPAADPRQPVDSPGTLQQRRRDLARGPAGGPVARARAPAAPGQPGRGRPAGRASPAAGRRTARPRRSWRRLRRSASKSAPAPLAKTWSRMHGGLKPDRNSCAETARPDRAQIALIDDCAEPPVHFTDDLGPAGEPDAGVRPLDVLPAARRHHIHRRGWPDRTPPPRPPPRRRRCQTTRSARRHAPRSGCCTSVADLTSASSTFVPAGKNGCTASADASVSSRSAVAGPSTTHCGLPTRRTTTRTDVPPTHRDPPRAIPSAGPFRRRTSAASRRGPSDRRLFVAGIGLDDKAGPRVQSAELRQPRRHASHAVPGDLGRAAVGVEQAHPRAIPRRSTSMSPSAPMP